MRIKSKVSIKLTLYSINLFLIKIYFYFRFTIKNDLECELKNYT